MTILSMLEVLIALLMIAAGIFLYRSKPAKDAATGDVDHYGSQGAVLLFVIAVIMVAHGFGAFEYRPSKTELETYKGLKDMGRH
jgi:hypothetical protein